MLEKISKTFNKIKGKVATTAMVAATTAQMAMVQAQAAEEPVKIVGKVLDVVVGIFPLIGGFFVLAGVFKLILAYRNNQPEDQTAAAKDIVIGAVFLVFGTFVWGAIKPSLGL